MQFPAIARTFGLCPSEYTDYRLGAGTILCDAENGRSFMSESRQRISTFAFANINKLDKEMETQWNPMELVSIAKYYDKYSTFDILYIYSICARV